MWIALIFALAVPQGAASGASAHPLESALFLEIPDVGRLLAEYEHAPWVQMVRDEAARRSAADILTALDIDSARALSLALNGLGVPEAMQAITVDDVRTRMQSLRSVSLSVTVAEKTVGEFAQSATAVTKCHDAVAEISNALSSFAAAHADLYPQQLGELELADALDLDLWGRPYGYVLSEDRHSARVLSLGADGKVGGFGADTDIARDFDFNAWMSSEVARRLGIEVCAQFTSDSKAREALDALTQVTLKDDSQPTTPPPKLALHGVAAELKQFRMAYGSHPQAWSLHAGEHVVLGIGAIALADATQRLDGHGPSLNDSPNIKRFLAAVTPSKGATVLNGFSNVGNLTFAFPQLAEALRKGSAGYAATLASTFGSIAWRICLDEQRFVTEAVTTHNPSAPSWLAAVANTPVPAELVRFVPDDAIGAYLTSIDGNALHAQMLELMGLSANDAAQTKDALAQIESKHEFSLKRDVFDSLGAGAAFYVLPIASVTSLPGVALVLELRDAAAFERGLRGLVATLEEQSANDFKIKFKKYREVPMWTLSFGNDEEPSGAAGGLSSFLTISPTITIVKNHAIVTLTSVRATKEIKRALGEIGAPHRLLSLGKAPPPEATSIGYMDWASFFDGLFGAARGALTLASGFGGELPFDANKLSTALPDPKVFSHFFQPTLLWTKSIDGGTYIRNEASFGPEAWANLLAIGAGAFYSFTDTTRKKVELAATVESPLNSADAGAITATKALLQSLATHIAVFQLDQEHLPKQLSELLAPTANYPQGFVAGGKLPVDSWNHGFEYQLAPDGARYRLWSLGPDGVDAAGAGDDLLAP